MPPDVLAVLLSEGTLFVGPPDRLRAVVGAHRSSAAYSSCLSEILALRAEGWRVRGAAIAWGLESFGRATRSQHDLIGQIVGLVESGQLAVGFLPLFRDDPNGFDVPGEAKSRLWVYQLGAGPLKQAPTVAAAPRRPPVRRFQPRPAPSPAFQEEKKAKATGNRIDITFEPNKSKLIKKCNRVVHIQFNRQYADGKVIKPGDYYSGFKYQDAVTTDDGWVIDHLDGETTPDYQQGVGDGKKNGGTKDATIWDAPNTSGGDKGFYDQKSNPGGWKVVYYEFATFAWCMDGPDCGTWYEGVTWNYTKTSDDARDGNKGVSKVTNDNVATAPTASQLQAFAKFNKDKGYKPCS